MKWNDIKSDIEIGNVSDALRELDCTSVVRISANLMRGARIYVLRSCVTAVTAHVKSDNKEVGGLLLGRVWEHDLPTRKSSGPLVILVDAVPSRVYRNSSVSLEMSSEIWGRVNERTSDGLIVAGWYHSHPNLGAFFSGTDRSTQRAFFSHPYSVGWVIDPQRNDEKVFVGGDSEEYHPSLLVIDHEFKMAQIH